MCPVQVFDDKNQFAEWFGDSFGKNAPGSEDDVAMEKRVVVIHRLHQILEPFMLRRQVQDVEGKLPPKVCDAACLTSIGVWHFCFGVIMPRVNVSLHDWKLPAKVHSCWQQIVHIAQVTPDR